ncbi:MAG: hypothetical protein IJ605_03385 [Prevotella sp.]|nr:hypothetical protein [Prevotella sp.]
MMRRKIPYRVCQCTSNGVVTHLESHLLRELVNREIHPIRCAESCKQKFMKGMRLGDLCAETGHFWWAMKVWKWTEKLIEAKDWDEWHDFCFDNRRVRLSDVVSEAECEILVLRQNKLWRALGVAVETPWNERFAQKSFGIRYADLWADKYDYSPEQTLEACEAETRALEAKMESERLFREGQPEV